MYYFLDFFYHLRDPIAALREIYKITRETLVIETYVEHRLRQDVPIMMFYPGRELANDPSNWWGPNIASVRALLTMAGFSRVEDRVGALNRRHFFYAYK
jgi:tRNA (mo5U34)-methyltransferase